MRLSNPITDGKQTASLTEGLQTMATPFDMSLVRTFGNPQCYFGCSGDIFDSDGGQAAKESENESSNKCSFD
jgi:hypothetical protein